VAAAVERAHVLTGLNTAAGFVVAVAISRAGG
jgi:hypothetical protein